MEYIELDSTMRDRLAFPLAGSFETTMRNDLGERPIAFHDGVSDSALTVPFPVKRLETPWNLNVLNSAQDVRLNSGDANNGHNSISESEISEIRVKIVSVSSDKTTMYIQGLIDSRIQSGASNPFPGEIPQSQIKNILLQYDNAYAGCVFSRSSLIDPGANPVYAANRSRILSYEYIGNNMGIIILNRPILYYDLNAPYFVQTMVSYSLTDEEQTVATSAQIFVQGGMDAHTSYVGMYAVNETRREHRRITAYNDTTRLATIDTSNGQSVYLWTTWDVMSIRRQPPARLDAGQNYAMIDNNSLGADALSVFNAGAAYTSGTVTCTGGHGRGMVINISAPAGSIISATILLMGIGYQVGDILTVVQGANVSGKVQIMSLLYQEPPSNVAFNFARDPREIGTGDLPSEGDYVEALFGNAMSTSYCVGSSANGGSGVNQTGRVSGGTGTGGTTTPGEFLIVTNNPYTGVGGENVPPEVGTRIQSIPIDPAGVFQEGDYISNVERVDAATVRLTLRRENGETYPALTAGATALVTVGSNVIYFDTPIVPVTSMNGINVGMHVAPTHQNEATLARKFNGVTRITAFGTAGQDGKIRSYIVITPSTTALLVDGAAQAPPLPQEWISIQGAGGKPFSVLVAPRTATENLSTVSEIYLDESTAPLYDDAYTGMKVMWPTGVLLPNPEANNQASPGPGSPEFWNTGSVNDPTTRVSYVTGYNAVTRMMTVSPPLTAVPGLDYSSTPANPPAANDAGSRTLTIIPYRESRKIEKVAQFTGKILNATTRTITVPEESAFPFKGKASDKDGYYVGMYLSVGTDPENPGLTFVGLGALYSAGAANTSGGSGSGLTLTLAVDGGGAIDPNNTTILHPGSGYLPNDVITVDANGGGPAGSGGVIRLAGPRDFQQRIITGYSAPKMVDGVRTDPVITVGVPFNPMTVLQRAPAANDIFEINGGIVSEPFTSPLARSPVGAWPLNDRGAGAPNLLNISAPLSQQVVSMQVTNDGAHPLDYSGYLTPQMVCYEIILLHVVLPNAPILGGGGGRIAFYPYVYVQLENVTAASGRNPTNFYSNNPFASRMTFRVPVTDISDPLLSPFIKLRGFDQWSIIKFKPYDTFRVSTHLPDGEVLQTSIVETVPPAQPNPLAQMSYLFGFRRVQ